MNEKFNHSTIEIENPLNASVT